MFIMWKFVFFRICFSLHHIDTFRSTNDTFLGEIIEQKIRYLSILLASLTSKYRLVFMEAMYLVCNISRFRMRFTGDVHVPAQIIFVCSMLETRNFC